MRKSFTVVLCALSISYVVLGAGVVQAGALAPGSSVGGKTVTEWTIEWNKWCYSFPGTVPHPFGTGAMLDQAVNQPAGDVFLLSGSTSGDVTRSFSVPAGKFLLVPIITIEWSQHESPDLTPDQIRALNHSFAEGVTELHTTLDGVNVPDLFAHRHVVDDAYSFDFVADNIFGVPAGPSGQAFSDGYYLILEPLSPGVHTLVFGGSGETSVFGKYAVNINDTITVVPEPGIVGLWGAALLLGRRRK
jgi:hypothetical protein